ncbi:RcpC/CpaB family pilus assembly protein [Streptomyces sp. NBC_00344]|uniref:RcpC/CpaB family pilus assembly protein n=1 Tax=Streptomyces sp. NBC_00344 TaxID=2975720 RepID=UPI002E218A89
MIPMPVPVVSAPEPRGVPLFPPVRVPGTRRRLRRALRRRHRALSSGVVLTAAALVAWAPPGSGRTAQPPDVRAASAAVHHGRARAGAADTARPDVVSAPVRIADAATVRLLEPGDHVDVIATGGKGPRLGGAGAAAEARVVAAGVRVAGVPAAGASSSDSGALIVLTVPRTTATALAGAAARSELTVTLC